MLKLYDSLDILDLSQETFFILGSQNRNFIRMVVIIL